MVGDSGGFDRLGRIAWLTTFHDAGDNGADEGNGEGVVDVEFEGGFGVVVAVMGQDVEERSH